MCIKFKTIKLLFLFILNILIFTTFPAFPTFSEDLCGNISGAYSGFYQDPEHLFPLGNYPISLTLRYDNGELFGYSDPSKDQTAARIGSREFLLFSDCKDSQISNLYFFPEGAQCADPEASELKDALVKQGKSLTLVLPYENAMIGTDLVAHLTRIHTPNPLNLQLIQYAENAQKLEKKWPQHLGSCH
jgi:hypothetical protein